MTSNKVWKKTHKMIEWLEDSKWSWNIDCIPEYVPHYCGQLRHKVDETVIVDYSAVELSFPAIVAVIYTKAKELYPLLFPNLKIPD